MSTPEPYMAVVAWHDAHNDPTQQTWNAEQESHAPLVIQTLGWVTREDKGGVTQYTERIDNQDGTFSFRGRGFIPRGMVVSVGQLAVPPPGRKKKA